MTRKCKTAAADTPVSKQRGVPDAPPPFCAPASALDDIVETSHGRIAVRQSSGSKLPLLLVHGNSGAKEIFGGQLDSVLAQTHRLIAVDLPGHGMSEDAQDPASTYTIRGYADAMCETMEILGVDQAAVIGWSLGGHIALEMIASVPGVVGAFVIGAPPLTRGPDALMRAFKPNPATAMLGRRVLDDREFTMLAVAVAGPDMAAALLPAMKRADGHARAVLYASLLAGQFEDEVAAFEQPRGVPIALVVGADDPFVDVEYVRAIRGKNLWKGACQVIPRAGHAPFLEAPSIVNHLLANFAREMDERATWLLGNPPLALSG